MQCVWKRAGVRRFTWGKEPLRRGLLMSYAIGIETDDRLQRNDLNSNAQALGRSLSLKDCDTEIMPKIWH